MENFSLEGNQSPKEDVDKNVIENRSTQKNERVYVTSLESYLNFLKNNPLEKINIEERAKSLVRNFGKISSKISNEITEQEIEELKKYSFIEYAGYLPIEIDRKDRTSATSKSGYLPKNFPIFNEGNKVIGQHYINIRLDLSPEERVLRDEIFNSYNKLFSNKSFYIEKEKNKILEEKVRDGDMVYLGQKSMEELSEMFSAGLPIEYIEESEVFNAEKPFYELDRKIYARIK